MAALIFHVDDSAEWRSIVEKIVTGEGYNLKSFSTTQEMLAAVEKQKPDLVLFDVMIEDSDSGLQAYDKVHAKYPALPIILITSLGEMTMMHFEDRSDKPILLEKPITPAVLKKVLAVHLKKN